MKKIFSILLMFVVIGLWAQVGSVNITVFDDFTKKPLEAKVKIFNKETLFSGAGNVQISELASGNYTFEISAEGYDTAFLNDINIVPNQNLTFSVGLIKSTRQIQEVAITKKIIQNHR